MPTVIELMMADAKACNHAAQIDKSPQTSFPRPQSAIDSDNARDVLKRLMRDPATALSVALEMNVSQYSLSRILNRLGNEGLAEKVRDRGTYIWRTTPQGRVALDGMKLQKKDK
jgi:transcription initiation factor IIE alpha subunit